MRAVVSDSTRENHAQAVPAPAAGAAAHAHAVHLGNQARLRARGSAGPGLGDLLAPMRAAFGTGFSGVQLHRDGRADAMGARALTQGEDIHLSSTEDPSRPAGRELMAHELAHVVQQRAAGVTASGSPVVEDVGLERQARAAGRAVASGAMAPDPGRAPAAGVVQMDPKAAAPVAGGNILYVGMNNFAPEIAMLQALYKGKATTVTAVTLSQSEKKTTTSATGKSVFDLTTDAGIDDFVTALALDTAKAGVVTGMLKAADAFDRDDMAHVIAVYAATQADGKDRMARVILSGHSRGSEVFAKGDEGDITFDFWAIAGTLYSYRSAAAAWPGLSRRRGAAVN